jgi:hypothetical protein
MARQRNNPTMSTAMARLTAWVKQMIARVTGGTRKN